MTTPETVEVPRSRVGLVLLNWGQTILLNVVLPLLTYSVLTGRGVSEVPALLASGAWPVVELALSFALHRRFDEISIMTLIFIVLGVVAGLGFNSARLVLVNESIVTGLFGVVALGSLALRRPLMFYFGRKFATNGTPESVAYWNGLWQYPGFRRTQRVITVVWGLVFIAEAVVRIGLSYALSTSAMVMISSVLPLAVTGLLVFWTISYGRRARTAALARVAATTGPTAPAAPIGGVA
jgi:intracellular septation protein A